MIWLKIQKAFSNGNVIIKNNKRRWLLWISNSTTLDKISNGTIHIAEGTMYPILYRLLDEGLISDEKRLVGKRQTRIYYHIEEKGIVHMQKLYEEYLTMINSIERIMENKYESE